jgi:hypothetical protein
VSYQLRWNRIASVISAINGKLQGRSSLAHLIEEIKFLSNGGRHISFVKVDRSQNRAGHCLANFARTGLCTVVWFGSGTEVLSLFLDQDLVVSPIA